MPKGKTLAQQAEGCHRKAPAHAAKRPHPHPETQTHLHPGQPSKNDRAEPDRKFPRASATATPHILLCICGGTANTTNPKHTQPTRNHLANEQTPHQYEAEKPDASAELSDARPATPTPGGQSRRAQEHCPNTTPHHTVEDGMQQRAPKAKATQLQSSFSISVQDSCILRVSLFMHTVKSVLSDMSAQM
ncbi:hypothetical protein GOODEAATRI_006142 [Goodea atripinnis]|uniref:Uncharacterized protein n=1 Tax=Goodea atripinnis TaxID=208336 RepID=A0ABV0PBU9_9TELE